MGARIDENQPWVTDGGIQLIRLPNKLEGKLGRFLIKSFLNLLRFESESESIFNSDENCL